MSQKRKNSKSESLITTLFGGQENKEKAITKTLKKSIGRNRTKRKQILEAK